MVNIVLIAILAGILGGAAYYIYKVKKSGAKCIGCPMSKQCGSCGCGCGEGK